MTRTVARQHVFLVNPKATHGTKLGAGTSMHSICTLNIVVSCINGFITNSIQLET